MTASTAPATGGANGFAVLRPISLDELDAGVALQTRVDRKYLVAPAQLAELIDGIADEARVLEIDGRRTFGYESTYFDTPTFDSYLGAVRSRPGRFKVRLRRYVDTDATWLEVKTRDRRGRTVKERVEWGMSDAAVSAIGGLGATARRPFLAGYAAVARHIDRLEPVVTTSYRRRTVVVGGTRVTVDLHLACTNGASKRAHLGDVAVIETKSAQGAGPFDRLLWVHGVRPTRISKFGIGLAALHPELPANKWHRTLERHVGIADGVTRS